MHRIFHTVNSCYLCSNYSISSVKVSVNHGLWNTVVRLSTGRTTQHRPDDSSQQQLSFCCDIHTHTNVQFNYLRWLLKYLSKTGNSPKAMIVCEHKSGSRKMRYLVDEVDSESWIQVPLMSPETPGWDLRVSSGRDGPSFDLDPRYVGGLFVFDNRRAQMDMSPHATWECDTHSTTVQTSI